MAAHRFQVQPLPPRQTGGDRAWYNDDDFGKAFSRLTKPGEVELTSPVLQEAWVAGAIGLAARMLGNVPFVIVQEDRAAMKEHEQRSKAAKTTGDLRMADERLRRARGSSPFRARDALLAGNLRAPEQALERISTHELQRLFERPNPEDFRSEIWQSVVTILLDSAVGMVVAMPSFSRWWSAPFTISVALTWPGISSRVGWRSRIESQAVLEPVGNAIRNTLPPEAGFSASARPPCRRTMRSTTCSPMPSEPR